MQSDISAFLALLPRQQQGPASAPHVPEGASGEPAGTAVPPEPPLHATRCHLCMETPRSCHKELQLPDPQVVESWNGLGGTLKVAQFHSLPQAGDTSHHPMLLQALSTWDIKAQSLLTAFPEEFNIGFHKHQQ